MAASLDASGAPVASAQVKVRAEAGGPVAIVLADGRGEFALPLAPGRYTVTIGADGFLESSVGVTVSPAQERLLDVTLAVAGFSETVNVDAAAGRVTSIRSATKTSTPLRDVPQAVSVVTSAMMADQRMTNMADVVRFMPGVGMAQGEGNRDTPILRGNSSTSDFFVDGIRDDVQYFRDVYNLERVEALKGPNAMIFGRGGAGGVINRVTRQAGWGQSREAVLQLGSWDNRRLTADVGTGLSDTIAARLTGLYEHSDSYRGRGRAGAGGGAAVGSLPPRAGHHPAGELRILPRRADGRPRRPLLRRQTGRHRPRNLLRRPRQQPDACDGERALVGHRS